MPVKHYPLESEGPNRLEISMDMFYKFTIKFDGKIVGQSVPIHKLQLGKAFNLPDESILKLKYIMEAGIISLESLVVIRDDKTLPGSAPVSAQMQAELAQQITVGSPIANPQENTSLRSLTVKQFTFESEDSVVHRIEASWKVAPYRYLITLDGKMFLAFDSENVTSRLPEGIKFNMPDGSIFEFINRMPTKLEHLQILRNGNPIHGSAGGTAPSVTGNKQTFRQISFKPNITSEQLQQTLVLPDGNNSSEFINIGALEKEKVEARRKTKQLLILGILFSLFAIVFGFLVYPLAICFGIIGLIVFPIVAAQQNKHINSPLNTSSPIEVIKGFYSDVMIYGANKNSDIKLASMPERTYQLVAPTSKDRHGCESVSSFKSSWENAYQKIHQYLIPNPSVIEKSQSLSFITTNYIIVFKTDDVFDIEYSGIVGIAEPLQYNIKPKYLATCHFKFQNIAVKIAGKWYLMAGEPGEPAFGNVELVVGP